MATYEDSIVLYWNQGKVKRTIQLNKNTNTPLTRTASGTKTYRAYSATIEALKACSSNPDGERVIQRPIQQETLIDSDEYIADENLLFEPHVKKRELEEVSADDQTI
jgi:hypothetical protein